MVFQIVSEPKGGRPKGGQGTGGHGKRQVGQEVVCDGPAEDVHARGPRGADGLPDLPSTVKKIVVEGWTLDVNIPPLRFRALVTRINRVIPSNRTAEQQPFLLSPFPALEYVAIDDPSVVPTFSPLRASAVRTVRICQMVFDPVALRQAFPPSCRTINVVFSAVSNYLAATRSAFCDPRFRWLCSSFDVLAFSDDYLPLTPHAGPSLHVTDAFGTAQLLRTVNKVLVAPEQMSFDLRTTALDRLDLTWFPSATTFSFELASEMTIDLPPNVEELHVLTDASVWFRGAAQSVAVTSERHVRLDFGDDDGVVVDLVEPADAVTVSMDWEATHTLAVQCASVSSGSVLPPQLHSLALSVPSLSPSLGVLLAIPHVRHLSVQFHHVGFGTAPVQDVTGCPDESGHPRYAVLPPYTQFDLALRPSLVVDLSACTALSTLHIDTYELFALVLPHAMEPGSLHLPISHRLAPFNGVNTVHDVPHDRLDDAWC